MEHVNPQLSIADSIQRKQPNHCVSEGCKCVSESAMPNVDSM